ncbi:TRAP transporter small permease [Alteribacillus sp. HJP-4]
MKIIDSLDEVISLLALAGIIVMVSANVVFRFILNSPIAWTEEVSLGLFVWLTFVGMSVVMKTNEHVSIDYFVRKFPSMLYKYNQLFALVIVMLVCFVVFFVWGIILTYKSVGNITPVLSIDYLWIYLAAPVGGLLSIWHITKKIILKDEKFLIKGEEEQ